jgi:sugar phosphate isomerase/epimerase
MIARLAEHELSYVATPYRRYRDGNLEAAYDAALEIAGKLTASGVRVFSPIVHSHSIAKYSGIDPTDNDLWMDLDRRLAEACDALVVACYEGWMHSDGVAEEISLFESAGKPVYYLDPKTMEIA